MKFTAPDYVILIVDDLDRALQFYPELKEHHMVVVGNPDEVINKLENFHQANLNQVICFKQAGLIPHANIMESIKRMAKYVLPHFNPHRTSAADETLFAAAGR